ncbi:MAG: DUF58 domain-containing protein [Clostridia bacterium]|nr:DUF58 domain-containing protein [Clostridia bacterium]
MHKRRAICLLWLAAVTALYFFENNSGTRALLATSILVPLISLISARHIARRLGCALEVPESAVSGEPVSGRCAITAGKLLALCQATCSVVCENRLTGERSTLEVPVDGRGIATFILHSRRCGQVSVTLQEVKVRDWFGLWTKAKQANLHTEVTLKPEPVTVLIDAEPGPGDTGAAGDGRLRRSDEPDGTEIRDYRPGDPVRQIHWKLSDKLDRLLLRETADEYRDQVLLLLETCWLDGASSEALDASMRAILSVSEALAAQDLPHLLCWQASGEDAPHWAEAQTAEDAATARSLLLSTAISEEGESVISRLLRELSDVRFRRILVFSPRPDAETQILSEHGPVTLVLPDTVPYTGADAGLQVVSFGKEPELKV